MTEPRTTEPRHVLAGLALVGFTALGVILAVELWHWRWGLYGFLTAVLAGSALSITKPAPPPSCTFCGRPADP